MASTWTIRRRQVYRELHYDQGRLVKTIDRSRDWSNLRHPGRSYPHAGTPGPSCSLLAATAHGPSSCTSPNTGTTWDTALPPAWAGARTASPCLYDFLEQRTTKGAFLVLKDGRMVLEKCFPAPSHRTAQVYWGQGQEPHCLPGGKAREDGFLDITDTTAQYLPGTAGPAARRTRRRRSPWHQLTMTSGLDDGNGNVDCTDPVCLEYLADAGTRWAYHNAPYTLLDSDRETPPGRP